MRDRTSHRRFRESIRTVCLRGSIFALCSLALAAMEPREAMGDETGGLRGDPGAIADARAMVEVMGGIAVWSELQSVHFVHEWDIVNRPDRYLEHEILDLTESRSYVTMKSEIYDRVRAYSPEHRYWNVVNGEFEYASDESYRNAMSRAPFSIYRIARAVASDDGAYRVEYGPMPDLPGPTALVFRFQDGEPGGWILLNVRKEPILWATTQYVYTFGPLARFGNLWVPNWATTQTGLVRYEMVSLTGSNEPADWELFVPPEAHRAER